MPRSDSTHNQRNRARIAQAAARLIAEHGLTDWRAAKRKACRELGLSENEGLPSNDEVEQELRTYNNLFRPDAQNASLRAQRADALEWMLRLSEWRPVLTGAVAAGWATPHNAITLELEAEDLKAVEIALANAGVGYTVEPTRSDAARTTLLRVNDATTALYLVVVSPMQRRHRLRRDEESRLDADALRVRIAEDEGAAASS